MVHRFISNYTLSVNLETVASIGSFAAAMMALCFSIYTQITDKGKHNSAEIAVLKDRVETMWLAWLRRGLAEGVSKDMFTVNSPIKLLARSAHMFEPVLVELRKFFQTLPAGWTDPEYQLAIEKHMGEEIVMKVCLPNNIHSAACLQAALELCRLTDEQIAHALKAAPIEPLA